MTRVAALALVLAACARSNTRLIEELEAQASRSPRPELEEAARRGRGLAPPLLPLRDVELPMLAGTLPAVAGEVNGVPMPLLLDTGSSAVSLTGEAARRVGLYLPRGRAQPIITPGRESSARAGAIRELRLGPLRLGPVQTLIQESERAVSHSALRRSDGYAIVGCSVLGHFRVTFDFARRIVRLMPHGRNEAADTLFVEMRIRGREYALLVDSGAASVYLEPWAAEMVGTELTSLEIEGRELPRVRAKVVSTFEGMEARPVRPAGLLGLSAFGPLVWTLDFSTRRLEVRPGRP